MFRKILDIAETLEATDLTDKLRGITLLERNFLPKIPTRQIRWKFANLVEQDYRNIKRLVKPGLGFGSFHRARHTLKGDEVMAMIRKGQLQDVKRNDIAGQGSSL